VVIAIVKIHQYNADENEGEDSKTQRRDTAWVTATTARSDH